MLLFSTVLDIVDSLKPDDFIRLVLDWNVSSKYEENIVRDIDWHGEHTVRYGNDRLWLEFVEYAEKGILAVRHEKITEGDVIWDSDFIVDFTNGRIAIQLDRTYAEEALVMGGEFSTPHFITLLIEHGYIKDDRRFQTLRTPILISDEKLDCLQDVLTHNKNYSLPVVLVSKTMDGMNPLSTEWLASRLKGAAHVLVEESVDQCKGIRELCGKSMEPYGAVWIFYPSESVRCKKYYYRSREGNEQLRLEKVIKNVIQYGISQRVDRLLTWNGVNSALLNDQLEYQVSVRKTAESARQKAEDEIEQVYDAYDEDLRTLQEKVAELTRVNEVLQYENQGLRAKYAENDSVPVIYMGDEEDYYQGEIRDFVLGALEDTLNSTEQATRKANVLEDILESNPYQHLGEDRKQRIKSLFKGYKSLTGAMRQELSNLGFEIIETGKHYKLTYRGDQRYMVTIGKTPSDNRSGSNSAAQIIKVML